MRPDESHPTPATTTTTTTHRGWLRGARGKALLLGATLGLLTALLGLAELVCRWVIPAPPDQGQSNPYRWGAGPCYRTELTLQGRRLVRVAPASGVWFTGSDPLPTALPRARTPGVARLVVLGESTGEMLEVRLATMASPRAEILRCAVPGGDTALVLDRAAEVTGYRPDAVVLVMGHNVRWRIARDPTSRWVSRLRQRSRLVVALTSVRPALETLPDPEERMRFLTASLARFEAQVRGAGTRAVYVILPSNLRFAPASDERGERSAEVFDARLAWWQGRRDEAIARLARVTDGSTVPQWHFELGDWLLARGDIARARAHFVLARDLDGLHARTTTRINDLLRASAARAGGVVYDLEALVSAHAPHGITGWESLMDNCHPTPLIQELASLDLLRLGACGRADATCPAGQPGGAPEPEARRGWARGAGEHHNHGENPGGDIEREVRNVLGQLLMTDGPQRATWALNLEQAVGSWALELGAPAMRGVIATALGDGRVARAPPEARDTAVTAMAAGLHRAGDPDGAEALLRQVLARDRSADAWMLAGRRALGRAQVDAAASAFARAAALDPSRADAPHYAARLRPAR